MSPRLAGIAAGAILLVAVSAPVSAQPAPGYIWIRYSPARGSWTGSTYYDIPMAWTSQMLGGTIAYFPFGNWGFRLNLDYARLLQLSPAGGYDYSDSSGTWLSYDLGVAYRLQVGTDGGFVSIFAGWGGTWVTFQGPSYGFTRQYTVGFVVGADAYVPLSGPWYLTGSVTIGPRQRYTYELGDPPYYYGTPGTAAFAAYAVGVGYRISPSSSVELGWRGSGFTAAGTGTPADGARLSWGGAYLGFILRR